MADRRSWIASMAGRDDWLAQVHEAAIDPDREIVDPHHHLWNRDGAVYELGELWADTEAGHNVVQTVFIECHASYRQSGPEHLLPIGETEYVAAMAKSSAGDPARATIAGIVAHADLRLDELDQVLDAHAEAANGLFCGIRHAGAFEPDAEALTIPGRGPGGLYSDPKFRRGRCPVGRARLAL